MKLGSGVFTTTINEPGMRTCETCSHPFPAHLRIDSESAAGLHSFCFVHYKQSMGLTVKRKPVSFEDLPSTVSFSKIEAGGQDSDEPIEFGAEDRGLADVGKEDSLLFILKTLPKDRYRVLALMLYMREQGFAFRYEDIASIWGFDKAMVRMTMKRMQATLRKAGISEDGLFAKR
jgi:hypothetical protein